MWSRAYRPVRCSQSPPQLLQGSEGGLHGFQSRMQHYIVLHALYVAHPRAVQHPCWPFPCSICAGIAGVGPLNSIIQGALTSMYTNVKIEG